MHCRRYDDVLHKAGVGLRAPQHNSRSLILSSFKVVSVIHEDRSCGELKSVGQVPGADCTLSILPRGQLVLKHLSAMKLPLARVRSSLYSGGRLPILTTELNYEEIERFERHF